MEHFTFYLFIVQFCALEVSLGMLNYVYLPVSSIFIFSGLFEPIPISPLIFCEIEWKRRSKEKLDLQTMQILI